MRRERAKHRQAEERFRASESHLLSRLQREGEERQELELKYRWEAKLRGDLEVKYFSLATSLQQRQLFPTPWQNSGYAQYPTAQDMIMNPMFRMTAEEKSQQIARQEVELRHLEERNSALGRNILEEVWRRQTLSNELDRVKAALRDKTAELETAQAAAKTIEESLKHEHDWKTAVMSNLSQDLKQAKAGLAEKDLSVNNLKAELAKMKVGANNSALRISGLETDLKTAEEELNEATQSNKRLAHHLGALKSKIAELEMMPTISNHDEKSPTHDAELAEKTAVISRLNCELKQAKADLAEKDLSVNNLMAELAKMKVEASNSALNFSSLETVLLVETRSNERLTHQLTALRGKMPPASMSAEKSATYLADLAEKTAVISSLNLKLTQARAAVAAKDLSVNNMKAELAKAKLAASDLSHSKLKIAGLEADLAKAVTRSEQVEKELEEVKGSNGKLRSRLAHQERKPEDALQVACCEELRVELATCNQTLMLCREEISDLKSKNCELDKKQEEYKKKYWDLLKDVSTRVQLKTERGDSTQAIKTENDI